MRIKWKTLCGLGSVSWAVLCAYDYLYGRDLAAHPDDPPQYPNQPAAAPLNPPIMPEPNDLLSYLEACTLANIYVPLFGLSLLAVGAALLCFARRHQGNLGKTSFELTPAEDLLRSALSPTCCPTFGIEPEIPEEVAPSEPSKIDRVANTAEANATWKAFTAMSRRCDGLMEEKRNLSKCLAQAEREGRATKAKMMEALRDKNALLRRLETATKEMRANTIAHKATIEKLEAAMRQVAQHVADKADLEKRLRSAESHCGTLKKSRPAARPSPLAAGESQVQVTDDIRSIELKLKDLESSVEQMKEQGRRSTDEEGGRLLRDVHPDDRDFVTHVEPSYTNLVAAGGPSAGHRLVDAIAPELRLRFSAAPQQQKLDVLSAFSATLFNVLFNMQLQQGARKHGAKDPQLMPLLPMVAAPQRIDDDGDDERR